MVWWLRLYLDGFVGGIFMNNCCCTRLKYYWTLITKPWELPLGHIKLNEDQNKHNYVQTLQGVALFHSIHFMKYMYWLDVFIMDHWSTKIFSYCVFHCMKMCRHEYKLSITPITGSTLLYRWTKYIYISITMINVLIT